MEKPRILIIEDDEMIADVCALILEGAGGFLTRTVTRAHRARTSARNFLPHLILFDLQLDDRNGIGVLDEIRTLRECAGIPAVLMTGSLTRREAEEGRFFDGIRILAKPFSPFELLACTAELLSLRPPALQSAA